LSILQSEWVRSSRNTCATLLCECATQSRQLELTGHDNNIVALQSLLPALPVRIVDYESAMKSIHAQTSLPLDVARLLFDQADLWHEEQYEFVTSAFLRAHPFDQQNTDERLS